MSRLRLTAKRMLSPGNVRLMSGDSIEIAGVVGEDFDRCAVAFQRHPVVLFEVINVEISEQLDVDQCAFAVFDVGTLVKLGDGSADLELRHLVLFHEDRFKVGGNAFSRFGDGVIEFVLCDLAVGH